MSASRIQTSRRKQMFDRYKTRVLFVTSIFLALASSALAQFAGPAVTFKQNEIAPAIFIEDQLDSTGRVSLQLNALTLTVIPRDHYNGENQSVSNYSLFFFGFGLLNSILVGGGDFGHGLLPDSSVLRLASRLIAAPFIWGNCQVHINLVSGNLRHRVGTIPSIVLGIQTDSYFGTDVHWLRFAPSAGFELAYAIALKDSVANVEPIISFAIQIGMQRQWDFSKSFHPQPCTKHFVGLKFGFFI
jgi:hypothetical protein